MLRCWHGTSAPTENDLGIIPYEISFTPFHPPAFSACVDRANPNLRAKNCFAKQAKGCYFYAMEERFYREQEIARLPAFLPAATYNLAHTLLARAGTCLFVPIRSLQYMAVLDAEEFLFVDRQHKSWVELAWHHFRT